MAEQTTPPTATETPTAPDGSLCLTCQNYRGGTGQRFLQVVDATDNPHPLVTACGTYIPLQPTS